MNMEALINVDQRKLSMVLCAIITALTYIIFAMTSS